MILVAKEGTVMYICSNKECFQVREPECPRSPSTAYSVTGTGPGAACEKPEEPEPEPNPPAKKVCKIVIKGGQIRSYRANSGKLNMKVC